MATITEKLMTAEEFSRLPSPKDGSKQELVRGVVITMPPPGFEHGTVQVNISSLLNVYVRPRKLGRVTVESGVITERDPDSVRGPDVAFWSKERLPLDIKPKGYPDVAADLCVEVTSDRVGLRRALEKLKEYFERGVRLVWIVDAEQRTVTVHRSVEEAEVLPESATLSGGEVLPGFQCKVADFFA